ncbi:MAG: hypothetical protein IT577_11445 [Verrucomicrobiae bacterium]|nr:hypothetical protein [Verrucomicrobiae bacterium]
MSGSQTRSPGGFEDARRAKMLRQVSEDCPSKLGLFRRVYSSQASPREAIKAQCLACCWMDVPAIRERTATQCTLWEFRPFVGPKGKAGR